MYGCESSTQDAICVDHGPDRACSKAKRPTWISGSVHPEARRYGDMHISGNAIVQLGDRHGSNQDLFEEGSETEKRNGEPTPYGLGAMCTAESPQWLTCYLQHSSMFFTMKVRT